MRKQLNNKKNYQLESLEGRVLMSADPIISEFMASNSGQLETVVEGVPVSPDWIEIHNTDNSVLNLQGWYLTDDSTNLTKWQLPSYELTSNAYQIIFASGLDIVDDNGALHTNFSLSANGEYLALVKPDGQAIVSEYATGGLNYLEQKENISYGIGQLDDFQPGLTLTADPTTGQVGFQNYSLETISLQSYAIHSQLGNLNPLAWHSLSDQGIAAWEEANPTDFLLTELNLSHSISLIPGQVYTLGYAVDVVALGDLSFTYVAEQSTVTESGITYYGELPVNEPGDWVENHADIFNHHVYFMTATPGYANGTGVVGFVADTKFSVDRGIYDQPISVEITTETINAVILYTTDGSAPSVDNGTLYNGTLEINSTTTLRAVAILQGYESSDVDTHTYLFLDDVLIQGNSPLSGLPSTWGGVTADYAMDPDVVNHVDYKDEIKNSLKKLPTLSLVLNQDDMFGSQGIYTNTNGSGFDWERSVSMELIYPEGNLDNLQIDAGIRIQGGSSRIQSHSPKHAFSLRFRSQYGNSTLEAPLFGDSPVTSFDTIQLRARYGNTWLHRSADERERALLIRDQFIRDSLIAMGQDDAGNGEYVHMYINGMYWGVYNMHERSDAAHGAAWNGGNEDDYDARAGSKITNGNAIAWNEMVATVNAGSWESIQSVIDVDNFIDWAMMNYFISNNDLKSNNNWRASGGGTERIPWRFYSWDAERSLEFIGSLSDGSLDIGAPNPSIDPTGLLTPLLNLHEFVQRFSDRVQMHFFEDGALTAQNIIERVNQHADKLRSPMVAESARWGDYRRDITGLGNILYTRDDHWTPALDHLINQDLLVRTQKTLEYFISVGLFTEVAAPNFDLGSGQVSPGTLLTMVAHQGVAYYTIDGSDPRKFGGSNPAQIILSENNEIQAYVPTVLDAGLGLAWTQPNFNDNTWISGSKGVGYERSTGYESQIGLDVESQMYNKNRTVYMRSNFNVVDTSNITALTLRMKYDDGFIAYLNGVKIAFSDGDNEAEGLWNGGGRYASQ